MAEVAVSNNYSDPAIPLVIHIEDDEGDARMVARSLSRAGCRARIKRVVDGRDALATIDLIGGPTGEIPNLVLLDLKLPYASGIEVLQKARSYDRLAKLPIVVLTSSDMEEDRQMCFSLGCTEFTVKPIDYFAFLEALKQLCEKYLLPEAK